MGRDRDREGGRKRGREAVRKGQMWPSSDAERSADTILYDVTQYDKYCSVLYEATLNNK